MCFFFKFLFCAFLQFWQELQGLQLFDFFGFFLTIFDFCWKHLDRRNCSFCSRFLSETKLFRQFGQTISFGIVLFNFFAILPDPKKTHVYPKCTFHSVPCLRCRKACHHRSFVCLAEIKVRRWEGKKRGLPYVECLFDSSGRRRVGQPAAFPPSQPKLSSSGPPVGGGRLGDGLDFVLSGTCCSPNNH